MIAGGLEFTANYHQYNYNLDSAQIYYERALEVSPKNLESASILTAYGGLLNKQGNIPKSLEYSLRAKQIYEDHEGQLSGQAEIKRIGQYGTLLNSIANIYNKFEDFDLANAYYEDAHLQFLSIPDTTSAGIILSNKGELLNQNGKYEEALQDLLQAKELKESLGKINNSLTMTNLNIANSYKGLGNYEEANILYQQVIANFEATDYDFGKALVYTYYGQSLLEGQNYESAYEICKKGNDYGLKIDLSLIHI